MNIILVSNHFAKARSVSLTGVHLLVAGVLLAALFVGLLATNPPLVQKTVDGKAVPGIIDTIANGFGSTLTNIGIVIVAGTVRLASGCPSQSSRRFHPELLLPAGSGR